MSVQLMSKEGETASSYVRKQLEIYRRNPHTVYDIHFEDFYVTNAPGNYAKWMVVCDRASVHSGFHLPGSCDTMSSVSLYKQKIDAMFDDSRSVTSQGTYGPNLKSNLTRQSSKVSSIRGNKTPFFEEDENDYNRNTISNSVQDRIEKMFAEMAMDSKGPLSDTIGVHTFSVDYLGSTPLQQKVTSLSGLQIPLKNLYFAYRKSIRHKTALTGQLEISKSGLKVRYQGEKGDLEQLNPFPTIAVWSAVKFVVQASEKENNILHYAFLPLITDPDNIDKQLLFKTLESSEKKYILSHNENAHSPLFAVVMRKIGVAKQLECHGFVCQTSEDAIVIAATLYKSLMSHMSQQGHMDPSRTKKKLKNRNGISCLSVASSNMTHVDVPIRPPRKKRSISSNSGDSDRGSKSISESFRGRVKSLKNIKALADTEPTVPPPVPANNKVSSIDQVKAKLESIKNVNEAVHSKEDDDSKNLYNESMDYLNNQHKNNPDSSNGSSVKSTVSQKIEMFKEMEKRKNIIRPPHMPPPIPVGPKSAEITNDVIERDDRESLRRSHSIRKSTSDSGDILTKVAIPRSGSFLNAGGLTRYKSIGQRNNGKKGGGSPLGFNELFNEFRVQENLHSMDEILNAIIDSEGMSFNDLKPIYKEFLLKLAVTLTKDELFQHSKAIMKRQKKKILRKNSIVSGNRKKIFKGAYGWKMVFRKPFGKNKSNSLKNKQMTPRSYEFHSLAKDMKNILASESSVSTSSYDLRHFHPKEPTVPPPKRQSARQRNSKRSEKIIQISKRTGKPLRPGERTSTSEDSDFLTLSGRLGCQNRNSSSGYVSCSECESESCIDRCYCSLKEDCKSKCYCSAVDLKAEKCPKSKNKMKACPDCKNRDPKCVEGDYEYSWCDCDTESCADSNKCYCRGDFPPPPRRPPPANPTKNTVKSSKSLEYFKSPSETQYNDHLKRAFDKSLVESQYKEHLQRAFDKNPVDAQYDDRLKRAFDHCYYEPLRPKAHSMVEPKGGYFEKRREGDFERSSCRKSFSTDNLGLDYELFLINKGLSEKHAHQRNMQRLTVRSTGGQDALSVKKSAEMAALFADVRLSQRTDVRNLKKATANLFSSRNGIYASNYGHLPISRKTSLEDSLGYLP